MAIAPIDLQVMYSQMHNVAKLAVNQQQGAVLSQQLQEQKIVQKNLEKAVAVKKAADNESKSQTVGDGRNGGNGSAPHAGGGRGRESDSSDSEPTEKKQIEESYLGQHIDVSL